MYGNRNPDATRLPMDLKGYADRHIRARKAIERAAALKRFVIAFVVLMLAYGVVSRVDQVCGPEQEQPVKRRVIA